MAIFIRTIPGNQCQDLSHDSIETAFSFLFVVITIVMRSRPLCPVNQRDTFVNSSSVRLGLMDFIASNSIFK
jgi:hypothetical protein